MLLFPIICFIQTFNSTKYEKLNFYQLIGVPPSSDDSEITEAYFRFLARKKATHNPSVQTLDLLKKTEFAFSILSNPSSRALYDLTGNNFLNITNFNIMGYQNDNTLETLKILLGKVPKEYSEYGGMVFYPISFSIQDFMKGGKKNVTVSRLTRCICPASSKSLHQCSECPSPYKEQLVTHTIRIPPGASQFYRIVVKALGDTSYGRGASDIVFIAVCEKADGFLRDGSDIITNLNLTFHQLISKNDIPIKNIDGEDILIPISEIRSAKDNQLIIPGKGFPKYLNPKERGDLIIHISKSFPTNFTQQQLNILSKLPLEYSAYE